MRTIQCSLVKTSSKYLRRMSSFPMMTLRTRSKPRLPNAFSAAVAYLQRQDKLSRYLLVEGSIPSLSDIFIERELYFFLTVVLCVDL